MTLTQQIITVAMVVLGTAVTRFLPFLIFPAGVRPAGHLLSEGCERFYRKPRHTGADLDHTCDPASCVETADAPVYCRRDGVLYAACAAGVLISLFFVQII